MQSYLKISLLALLFLGLTVPAVLGQNNIDEYIDEYKNNKGVWALTIPGWLVRKGVDFTETIEEEEEKHAYMRLVPYLKEVRILAATEGAAANLSGSTTTLMSNMLAQEGQELYASFREGKEHINVIVEAQDRIIKNIGLIIHSEEEVILVRIKADLPEDILEDPRFRFNQ